MAKFTIYGKPDCPFCDQAKGLAESEGFDYEYRDVMADPDARSDLMHRLPGIRTVPQIFYGDKHVGGYTEFAGANKTGALKLMMETYDGA